MKAKITRFSWGLFCLLHLALLTGSEVLRACEQRCWRIEFSLVNDQSGRFAAMNAPVADNGTERDLRKRLKVFALRIIRLYTHLPRREEARVIGKQILRSGTSVGAHHREASRARSTAEFISKLEVGLQELEETSYWLELLAESGIVSADLLHQLQGEANELNRILTSCVVSAKKHRNG